MPTISRQDSIAANTRSGNVLAGEQFEFLPSAAIVAVYASAAAVGVEADFNVGGEAVVAGGVIPSTNRFPVRPDDALVQHGGLPGERLFLSYLNTTGAAIVVSTLIDVQT